MKRTEWDSKVLYDGGRGGAIIEVMTDPQQSGTLLYLASTSDGEVVATATAKVRTGHVRRKADTAPIRDIPYGPKDLLGPVKLSIKAINDLENGYTVYLTTGRDGGAAISVAEA